MPLSVEKAKLRETMRRLWESLPEEKAALDARLLRNVTAHPWFAEADGILCYWSLAHEPDTLGILRTALECGKWAALPKCLAAGEMQFVCIRQLADTAAGKFGIPEPTGTELARITPKTLCLLPAFAFTHDGKRLGKGGGYYDRFLAQHPELRTMGLTYACLLQEDIPTEPHDITAGAVVTDCAVSG